MKIAVPFENGSVYERFGHAPAFAFYTVENGTVTGNEVLPAPGEGHTLLTAFLFENGADTLVCGGIGMPARRALQDRGIRLYMGVSGSADTAVEALLAGVLTRRTDAFGPGEPSGCCGDHDTNGHL